MALSCPTPSRSLSRFAIFIAAIFGCGSSFAYSSFSIVPSTPYDHQMSRVHPALSSAGRSASGTISLDTVNAWMTQLRAMPYRFSPYWQTPNEVSLTQASDCKGKALALYAQLRRSGAKFIRVVIGKRHIYASRTHAWLEWETTDGTYVLDPTFNHTVVRAETLDRTAYIPFYAYDAEHKYRAATPGSGSAKIMVAAGPTNRIYRRTEATLAQSRMGGANPISYRAVITPEHRSPDRLRSLAATGNPGIIRTQQMVKPIQPQSLPRQTSSLAQTTIASPAPWQTHARQLTSVTKPVLAQNRLTTQRSTVVAANASTQAVAGRSTIRLTTTRPTTTRQNVQRVTHHRSRYPQSHRLASRA